MFSADLPREWLSTPPGNAPIELVYDVLLVTGDPGVDTSGIAAHPPVLMPTYPHGPAGPAVDPAPIDLGFGIEMTRLERAETERILVHVPYAATTSILFGSSASATPSAGKSRVNSGRITSMAGIRTRC